MMSSSRARLRIFLPFDVEVFNLEAGALDRRVAILKAIVPTKNAHAHRDTPYLFIFSYARGPDIVSQIELCPF